MVNKVKLFVKDVEFYKKAATIAIPVSLQSMITIGVNLMDSVMVGSLGDTALSAVGQANQFVTLYHICCMGIGMGASVLTSRFWGMKDIESLKKTVTIMLRFCLSLGLIVFMLPTIFVPDKIMWVYIKEEPVIQEGIRYLAYMVPCFLLLGLSLTCTIVLRSVGQVKIPLYTSIGAFFVNVGCNYIFIFGKFGAPAMGVAGAGLGTLFARLFEFLVICGYFFLVDRKISYRIKDLFGECKSLLKDYFTISLPVFVSDTLLALGNSAVAIVMGRIGTNFVAANSITMVTQQLSNVLIQGICHAGCIMTGHTLGGGEVEKAQDQAWTFLSLGTIVGIVAGGIILIISRPVISLYDVEEVTKAIARQQMFAISFIVVFQSMNSILTKGVLRGGGDTVFLMAADILFLWVASIPLGALAGLYFHLDAFWIYFFLKIDQIIKAVWCVFRLNSRKWIKKI